MNYIFMPFDQLKDLTRGPGFLIRTERGDANVLTDHKSTGDTFTFNYLPKMLSAMDFIYARCVQGNWDYVLPKSIFHQLPAPISNLHGRVPFSIKIYNDHGDAEVWTPGASLRINITDKVSTLRTKDIHCYSLGLKEIICSKTPLSKPV